MAFAPGFLDELRARVVLPALVGRHVKLVRRGREFVGLCPFHNEKTPSFYVVEDKNFFHCFGCGAHGDAVGFVMRADNLDFLEAVEKLAGEAGLAVPQSTPEEREKARRQKTLLETLEAAAAFYEARLWSPAGAAARDYLSARGLAPDAIQRFRLGWAPDERQALRNTLGADYTEPLLIEAGLLRRREDGGTFDYFRGRVIFPIGDRAGRVVAFGGRVLGDGQPKYLNSPESPVFEKSRVLYGWSAARAASAEGRAPIVTEGYMDVIALHGAGFSSAVAPLGTALGDFQLQELWRLGPEPILCFDGDAAGQRAAVRVLRRALPLLRPGCSLRFARLPSGEDPDSLLHRMGPPAIADILAAARPLSQVLWEVEFIRRPADTPERRADLEQRLSENVAQIADPRVRGEYRRFIRDRLYEVGRAKRAASRIPAQPRAGFVRSRPAQVPRLPTAFVAELSAPVRSPGRGQREALIAVLIETPVLIAEFSEQIAALDFPELELNTVRAHLLRAEASGALSDSQALGRFMESAGLTEILNKLRPDTLRTRTQPELAAVRRDIQATIRSLLRKGSDEIAAAGQAFAASPTDENWERLKLLKDIEAREDSTEAGD